MFCFPVFDHQYQCNRLPGKARLWNDLLWVEWNVKPYTLTHLQQMSLWYVCFFNGYVYSRQYSTRSHMSSEFLMPKIKLVQFGFYILTSVVLDCACVTQEVALFDGKIKQCTALSVYLVSLSDWLEFMLVVQWDMSVHPVFSDFFEWSDWSTELILLSTWLLMQFVGVFVP